MTTLGGGGTLGLRTGEGDGDMVHFEGVALSDTGLVRELDEDSGLVSGRLALVADGVGGEAAGEVASTIVTDVLAEFLHDADPRARPSAVLRSAVAAAQTRLRQEAARRPETAGMATTLTAVLTDGRRTSVAHVGDSRLYILRRGTLTCLTDDHTLAREMVADGVITPGDALHHAWSHVLVRSLNGGPAPVADEPDVLDVELRPGDRLLLATDGLTDLVPEERLRAVLGFPGAGLAASRLLEDALEAGGHDNITCVVLDVRPGEAPASERPRWVGAAAGHDTGVVDPTPL
jgi:PPM family protein phosphatase